LKLFSAAENGFGGVASITERTNYTDQPGLLTCIPARTLPGPGSNSALGLFPTA